MLLTRVLTAWLRGAEGAYARAVNARGLLTGARLWACTIERMCAHALVKAQTPLQCDPSVFSHHALPHRGSGREKAGESAALGSRAADGKARVTTSLLRTMQARVPLFGAVRCERPE